jgi:hypothetical protein
MLRLPQAGHISRGSKRESGKFGPRANQRVEIELLPIDAPPHRLGAFTIAARIVADLSADISRDASTSDGMRMPNFIAP